MSYKKAVYWGGLALFIVIAGILFADPLLIKSIKAKYKSTDHFLVLLEDPRILYEAAARDKALRLSKELTHRQNEVEHILGAPFKKPINVYICGSQEVFNEYVPLSKRAKGAVHWGKVFLSPGAFNRGPLSRAVSHELTHYLFFSYLGEKAHVKGIPLWFREAIAVFVANGGAEYTSRVNVYERMTEKERAAYLSGNVDFWFDSSNPRDAVTNEGVANWLLYRIGALFVHFLQDTKPQAFEQLIQKLLLKTPFDSAVQDSYDKDIDILRREFTDYLKAANGI